MKETSQRKGGPVTRPSCHVHKEGTGRGPKAAGSTGLLLIPIKEDGTSLL